MIVHFLPKINFNLFRSAQSIKIFSALHITHQGHISKVSTHMASIVSYISMDHIIMEEDYLKTVFRDSYICVESLTKMYFAVTLVCIFHQGRFYISLSPLILEYHTVEPEH